MDQTADAAATAVEDTVSDIRGSIAFLASHSRDHCFALLYAVTRAFVWDEGYHLIAAQKFRVASCLISISVSRKHPSTPFSMPRILKLFGQHWRPVHVGATLVLDGLHAAHRAVHVHALSRPPLASCLAHCCRGFRRSERSRHSIRHHRAGLWHLPLLHRGGLSRSSHYARARQYSATASSVACWPASPPVPRCSPRPSCQFCSIWIWLYDRVGLPWRKALAFIAGIGIAFLPVRLALRQRPRPDHSLTS